MAFNISYVYILKDRFSAVARRVSKSADHITGRIRKVGTQAEKTDKAMAKLQSRFFKFAGAALVLFSFGKPIRDAVKFQGAMAEVNKTVNFSKGGLEKLSQEILDLTKTLPLSTDELAKLAAAAGQMGFAEDEIASFVETAAKMSTAFDMDTAATARSIGVISNIFSLSIKEFEGFADAVNTQSNNSIASADEMLRALSNKGAAAGKAMNMTDRDTLALAGTFIELGVRADRVGSVMDAMSRRLLDTSVVGKEFAESFSKDPTNTLIKYFDALNKLDTVARSEELTSTFGEFGGRIGDVARTLDTVYLPALERTAKGYEKVATVNDEFEKRMEAADKQIILFKNSLKRLSIGLGTEFLPITILVVKAFTKIVNGIGWLNDRLGPIVPIVFAFVGAIIAVTVATYAWALATTVFGAAAAVAFLPITLMIAGIAALIVLITWLIKKIKSMGGLGAAMKAFAQGVIDFMIKPLMAVAKIADKLAGTNFAGGLEKLTRIPGLEPKMDTFVKGTRITTPDFEKAQREMSFGGANAVAAPAQKATADVNITLNDPSGAIQSVQSNSSGQGRINIGQNMGMAVLAGSRGGK